MEYRELPLPYHFDPGKVDQVWKVSYRERAAEAARWAKQHKIRPAATDEFRICLLIVDMQNAFCIPGFELFVAGRTGNGAVEDSRRLCEFIYRNLNLITQICLTMDTHQVAQIFHPAFWIDEEGGHPPPFTTITEEDVREGRWRFNPALGPVLGLSEEYAERYLLHYTRKLKEGGRYELTIWPYHALLGSVGHALVAALEEAVFFHSVARHSPPDFQVKGDNPLTEHYSVFGPEVLEDHEGRPIAQRNEKFIEKLLGFEAVIIAGEAKSHCLAWTVEDLLREIRLRDERLAGKVYLLEDCTSPVVVPGALDYTAEAEAAFRRFAEAGMHLVRSSEPLKSWPGLGS